MIMFILKRHIYALGMICCVWGATHLFTLRWGLPSPVSFAVDTIPANTDYSARQMMEFHTNKYPPLQYLVVSLFFSEQKETGMGTGELILERSSRIYLSRLICALMTLGAGLVIYFIMWESFPSRIGALIASLFYVLNPISLYYSHTSNMDQPCLFWFILSLFVFIRAERASLSKYESYTIEEGVNPKVLGDEQGMSKRKALVYLLHHCLFGILVGLAFCTKDFIYSSYIITIPALLIYNSYTQKKSSRIFWVPMVWLFSCTLTTYIIYQFVGGHNKFIDHFTWITNTGASRFVQYDTSLLSRMSLLEKSFVDFAIAANYPLLICLFLSVVSIAYFAYKRTVSLVLWKGVVFHLLIFFLLFISLECTFIQVVRYSYPRYYLPLIPIASCLAGFGYIIFQKHSKPLLYFFSLFFFLNIILCVQYLYCLKNDTRSSLRFVFKKNNLQSMRIAISGIDPVATGCFKQANGKYAFMRTANHSVISKTGFFNSKYTLLELSQFGLSMLNPRIIVVVNPKTSDGIFLENNAYELVESIRPPSSFLFSFHNATSPTFDIYHQISKTVLESNDIKKQINAKDYGRLLLELGCYIDNNQLKRQFVIVGSNFPKFTCFDASYYNVSPTTLNFLANSYELCGRLKEAAKSHRFVLEHYHDSNMKQRSRLFFKRHPSFLQRRK